MNKIHNVYLIFSVVLILGTVCALPPLHSEVFFEKMAAANLEFDINIETSDANEILSATYSLYYPDLDENLFLPIRSFLIATTVPVLLFPIAHQTVDDRILITVPPKIFVISIEVINRVKNARIFGFNYRFLMSETGEDWTEINECGFNLGEITATPEINNEDHRYYLRIEKCDDYNVTRSYLIHEEYLGYDEDGPEIEIIDPVEGSWINSIYKIKTSVSDYMSRVKSVNIEISDENTNIEIEDINKNNESGYYEYDFNTLDLNDGIYSLKVNAKDNAKNRSDETITFYIDNTAPETIVDYNNKWQDNDSIVSLECFDTGSGCANIYYSINGNTEQVYDENIIINTDGNNSISFYSVDSVGNIEEAQTIYVAVDKTPPTIVSVNFNDSIFRGETITIDVNSFDNTELQKVIANISLGAFEKEIDLTFDGNLYVGEFDTNSDWSIGDYRLLISAIDFLNNANVLDETVTIITTYSLTFSLSKNEVTIGDIVTLNGNLKTLDKNENVNDGNVIISSMLFSDKNLTTDENGNFSLTFTTSTVGTFDINAKYFDGYNNYSDSKDLKVNAKEEEKKRGGGGGGSGGSNSDAGSTTSTGTTVNDTNNIEDQEYVNGEEPVINNNETNEPDETPLDLNEAQGSEDQNQETGNKTPAGLFGLGMLSAWAAAIGAILLAGGGILFFFKRK